MNTALIQKIKEVTELQGTSSFEGEIRAYLRPIFEKYSNQITYDGLGGIFAIKKSKIKNAPTILVAAHMDEVGFMVSEITDNGFFRVVPIGGWNPLVVQAQRFTLITKKQQKIPVISSSTPPHLLRGIDGKPTMPKIEAILFDGGFRDAKEVASFGIQKGDFIIPEAQAIITANQKNMIAKAWDNRFGILMVSEAVKALADIDLAVNLVIGANVQEEVGLRGAHVSTNQFKPDLCFAIDCSPADDIDKKEADGAIGEGPIIRLFDPGHIMLQEMKHFVVDTAEANAIPYQYYFGKGGTDAGATHLKQNGIPSTTIGVVARYIHSHQTLFSLADFEQAQKLLLAILKNLDAKTVNQIKCFE
ncbi:MULTISPECIES: glutamyl aminopeptidase [unclassified Enterococcus]|uniref:glutamyl aminopeptidase n=1 Tax=unclassified Enterococcus TaxID=2608891 RepID=UPI001554230F|nr:MULTISPECIES: glutamyl aminopeptidase [unclassified Enterococcus]MBS7576703.1 glutamyl aminopeptidase [Enterococcus sp. MMGLQ5-2]MBS7583810.1 glutamyl aminopeptidase [Enterococcus sp. MMGLQ5-1]NPD11671.1 glutamyl aminopeptidase [Enterococcus sp. MMGLQ5-1]NPD36540.1 glutamyl aminopeptidase [Enterococcus sp. MMGLQ5-2]